MNSNTCESSAPTPGGATLEAAIEETHADACAEPAADPTMLLPKFLRPDEPFTVTQRQVLQACYDRVHFSLVAERLSEFDDYAETLEPIVRHSAHHASQKHMVDYNTGPIVLVLVPTTFIATMVSEVCATLCGKIVKAQSFVDADDVDRPDVLVATPNQFLDAVAAKQCSHSRITTVCVIHWAMFQRMGLSARIDAIAAANAKRKVVFVVVGNREADPQCFDAWVRAPQNVRSIAHPDAATGVAATPLHSAMALHKRSRDDEENVRRHHWYSKNPSAALCLRNLFGLTGGTQDLIDDVVEECAKFGAVEASKLLLDAQAELGEEEVGLLILFEAVESAQECFRIMNGRLFMGRRVSCCFVDDEDPPKTLAACPPLHTTILLRNLVLAGEVDNSLYNEVEEVCSEFGSVREVRVAQSSKSEVRDGVMESAEAVRVLVDFTSFPSAAEALLRLDKRIFAGRSVAANLYDSERMRRGDWKRSPNVEPDIPMWCVIDGDA